jgi:hypothetical protein
MERFLKCFDVIGLSSGVFWGSRVGRKFTNVGKKGVGG